MIRVHRYFFALRALIASDPDEEDRRHRPRGYGIWLHCKTKCYFFLGRIFEHPIYLKTLAPVVAPIKSLCGSWATFVIKNNPRNYIKIIVSFFQISTAFLTNIDVNWPSSVQSLWKFFSFLTMEVFKLYGYDCMFGGVDYLGRLVLVTTVPLAVILFFSLPWMASYFYKQHRARQAASAFCNNALWVVYLIYPLLCLMTVCMYCMYVCMYVCVFMYVYNVWMYVYVYTYIH